MSRKKQKTPEISNTLLNQSPMKTKRSQFYLLRQSVRFWAWHLGYSPSTISRRLAQHGIHAKRRTAKPGVTLREVLYVMPHFW